MIVREFYNRTKDQWEFLTDEGHMLVQGPVVGELQTWTLWEVATQDTIRDDWNGRQIWERDLKFGFDPDQVLARYEVEQNPLYSCELFAHLSPATKGELDGAWSHIEAGDLRGALQHLAQFATHAIEEFGDLPEASMRWSEYGPLAQNGHLSIRGGTVQGKYQVILVRDHDETIPL